MVSGVQTLSECWQKKQHLKCQLGDKYLIRERSRTWSASHEVPILFRRVLSIEYQVSIVPIYLLEISALTAHWSGVIKMTLLIQSPPYQNSVETPSQSQSLELLSISQSLSLCLNPGEQCPPDSCYQQKLQRESHWEQCGPLSLVEIQRGSALIGRKLHSVATPVSLMS